MPVISIVVPVYNAERFLPRSLNSLTAQTFSDIEILCVNDGSKDQSPAIMERYAQADPRVKVIHQPNGGAAAARNAGMAQAAGEYLLFIDADDWVEPTLCEAALEAITRARADVACWGYVREKAASSVPVRLYEDGMLEGEACRALYQQMFGLTDSQLRHPERMDQHINIWNKLYRASLLRENGITFQSIRDIGAEDLFFNIQLFFHVRKAATLAAMLTHYCKGNPDSITAAYQADRPRQWKSLYERLGVFIHEHQLGATFRQALDNKIALSVIWLGLDLVRSKQKAGEKIRRLGALLRDKVYGRAIRALSLGGMKPPWFVFFLCAKARLTFACYLLFLAMESISRHM